MTDNLCAEALRLAGVFEDDSDTEMWHASLDAARTLRSLVAAHDALLAEVIGLREERDAARVTRNEMCVVANAAEDDRDTWRARAERAEAALRVAAKYYTGYCQDEAYSRACCIDDEQHEAAQAFRDAVLAAAKGGGDG